jgi:endonuclease YncB( thermonuclease family)
MLRARLLAVSLLASLMVSLLAATPAQAVQWSGTVVGVADGDTLTLLDAEKTTHRIRLDGIDAPEKAQPWGERSRQSLSSLAYGRAARAECPKTDRYGRAVCVVTVEGVDVGLEQLRRGLAWHYRKYAHEQPVDVRTRYRAAEEIARAAGLGLWAGPTPVPPWEFRRVPAAAAP